MSAYKLTNHLKGDKKMKKKMMLGVVLCVALLMSMFAGTGFTAFALGANEEPEDRVTVGGLEYRLTYSKYVKGYEYHLLHSSQNDKTSGDIVIPDEINGIPVTCIGSNALAFSGITSVVIGNNVKMIDYNAFCNCGALSTVTFGENVAEIGKEAFSGCSSLTSVTLSDSVKKIGDRAFDKCFHLKTFVAGMGLKELGEHVFPDFAINVYLPDSVTFDKSSYDPNMLFVRSLDEKLREEQSALPAQIAEHKAQLEREQERLEAINAYFNENSRTASVFGDGESLTVIIGCAALMIGAFGGILIGRKTGKKPDAGEENK